MAIASVESIETKAPSRRCIVCRGNGAKYGLLRFGVMNGELFFDLRQKMPGRGYYVCAQPACLQKAWATGFRKVIKAGPQSLGETCESFIQEILIPGFEKRYRECILAGRQSGQLFVGSDAVEQAAREDRLMCYIIATDASESTRRKYEMNAERKQLPVCGHIDRAELGRLIGSTDKVLLGWESCSLLGREFLQIEEALKRFRQN